MYVCIYACMYACLHVYIYIRILYICTCIALFFGRLTNRLLPNPCEAGSRGAAEAKEALGAGA